MVERIIFQVTCHKRQSMELLNIIQMLKIYLNYNRCHKSCAMKKKLEVRMDSKRKFKSLIKNFDRTLCWVHSLFSVW